MLEVELYRNRGISTIRSSRSGGSVGPRLWERASEEKCDRPLRLTLKMVSTLKGLGDGWGGNGVEGKAKTGVMVHALM